MNSHRTLHQALLNEWASRFADQKASGLTVRDWCSQNNLSTHKYNYWKHQLKEAVTDQVLPDIAPLSLPITNSANGMSSQYQIIIFLKGYESWSCRRGFKFHYISIWMIRT